MLSKLSRRKGDDETCPWNYCFILETMDRTMELYAPTRKDREKWVHMFNMIIDMNKQNIGTSTMSPFVYEMQKKYLVLDKNTYSSVTSNSESITERALETEQPGHSSTPTPQLFTDEEA